MKTLHLPAKCTKKLVMSYENTFGPVDVLRCSDGSFIVGPRSVIHEDPDLMIGCLGLFYNTDDLEWATMVAETLSAYHTTFVVDFYATSFNTINQWRQKLEEVCGTRYRLSIAEARQG